MTEGDVTVRFAAGSREAIDAAVRLFVEGMARSGVPVTTTEWDDEGISYTDVHVGEQDRSQSGGACDVLLVLGETGREERDSDQHPAWADVLLAGLEAFAEGGVLVYDHGEIDVAEIDGDRLVATIEEHAIEKDLGIWPIDLDELAAWGDELIEGAESAAGTLGQTAVIGVITSLLRLDLEPFDDALDAALTGGKRARHSVVLTVAHEWVHTTFAVQERERDLGRRLEELVDIARGEVEPTSASQVEDLASALEELIERIDDAVLVLGKFHEPHQAELEEVVDALTEKGYDANIAEDLPGYQEKSLEGNVATYMMLSRFSVMVDREASGHVVEYEIASRQREVLARLVPEGGGSTYMIGGVEDVDANHIRAFEFENAPLERLDEAVEWAETVLERRRAAYQERYPWRDDKPGV